MKPFESVDLPWFAEGAFPLYLAPMAGFTDIAFRALCRRLGADVVVTEFVLGEALVREGERAWETVDFTPEQRPMGVQIFGAEPTIMAEAARMITDRLGPDFIDLNFGCPSPKVCSLAAGASLLRDLPRLTAVAEAVVKAVPQMPVTAKIRLGWDDARIVAPEAARLLEEVGIRALAIHGRTKVQGYQGEARWDLMGEVAAARKFPVIGNGGVRAVEQAVTWRGQYAIRGMMVGRAALGNPWIFGQIRAALEGRPIPSAPAGEARWQAMLQYARDLLAANPRFEARKFGWVRARLKPFLRELPGSRQLRHRVDSVESLAELEELYQLWREEASVGVA